MRRKRLAQMRTVRPSPGSSPGDGRTSWPERAGLRQARPERGEVRPRNARAPTKKGPPVAGQPLNSPDRWRRSGRHLVLVVDRRSLAQDLEDLLLRGAFVDLLHRGQFAGETAGRAFEDLALGIALLGLV